MTVGNFDGMHLGHQRILSTARGLADADRSAVVAMTFQPTPDAVLRPRQERLRIVSHARKCELLAGAGADWVVTVPTDMKLLGMAPEAFIQEIILDHFAVRHIVEGDNFFFGRGRSGNVQMLADWQERGGFRLHIIEPVTLDFPGGPQRVSSTMVRHLIGEGRVEDAARCLGRVFSIAGQVVAGDGRGRELNSPTANLEPGEQIVPADGVYAGRAQIAGRQFVAAISIGNKPTLRRLDKSVVEAFLLDAGGDYYGQEMELSFVARLRDQHRFADEQALKRQIAEDVQRVREICR